MTSVVVSSMRLRCCDRNPKSTFPNDGYLPVSARLFLYTFFSTVKVVDESMIASREYRSAGTLIYWLGGVEQPSLLRL
eukprot:scaffold2983_cov53-Attheya_sp.AAC.3